MIWKWGLFSQLAVFLSKISPKQDFNKTAHIFLFLWPGFHWFFLKFLVVFTYILAINLEPKVVFIKCKKKKWNHLGIRMGPRTVAPVGTTVRGPSRMPKWFQIILFLHFMKPPWFQDLLPKYPWNHTKLKKKINETRSHKKCAVFS